MNEARQSKWVALMALTALAVYLCWRMLEPFAGVLAWGSVLAIVFYPIRTRIEARLHRRGLSALCSVIVVLVVVLVPVSVVTSAVVREASALSAGAQGSVDRWVSHPAIVAAIERLADRLSPYVNLREYTSPEAVRGYTETIGRALASGTLGVLGGALGALLNVFFVLFTLYYLFRDGDRIAASLAPLLPLDPAQAGVILARTREIINASVLGMIVIATIQGSLGGLMFWVLGLPSPVLWGSVMTILSMIPVAGSFIVWVPAAAVLALTGHWVKAAVLVAWGSLVMGLVDNLLRPRLVGQRANLHELVVFFSVLGGLRLFGLVGLLVGPVVVAVTLALVDVLHQSDGGSRVAAD